MRISDWSSDVCSSDLDDHRTGLAGLALDRVEAEVVSDGSASGRDEYPVALVFLGCVVRCDGSGHATVVTCVDAGDSAVVDDVAAFVGEDFAECDGGFGLFCRCEIGRAAGRERVCQYV